MIKIQYYTGRNALAHLEQLVNENTRPVDLCEVEWAPVFKEREIKQTIVDAEVVV